MVRITFVSNADIAAFARRNDLNIYNIATACEGNDVDSSHVLQNDPYLYDEGGVVDAYRKSALTEARTVYKYSIYLSLKAAPLAGREDTFLHDLQHQPMDVCFRLGGGNMMGLTFVTNTTKVSREEIMHAVARTHQK